MKKVYTGLILMIFFTLLLGFVYPLFLWGVGKVFFPHKSSGSFLVNIQTKKIIGSTLIGQNFHQKKYFHSRPSACNYDGMLSTSSNLAPTSKHLQTQVMERIETYKQENDLPESFLKIPSDAVFASGSGLDPHISLENASLQAHRIAAARNIPDAQVMQLIEENKEKPFLGILGHSKISVFLLNAKLDNLSLEKKR